MSADRWINSTGKASRRRRRRQPWSLRPWLTHLNNWTNTSPQKAISSFLPSTMRNGIEINYNNNKQYYAAVKYDNKKREWEYTPFTHIFEELSTCFQIKLNIFAVFLRKLTYHHLVSWYGETTHPVDTWALVMFVATWWIVTTVFTLVFAQVWSPGNPSAAKRSTMFTSLSCWAGSVQYR